MKRTSKTKQQLLLEIEELRTKLDVAQQGVQEANELMLAEMTESKRVEEALREKTHELGERVKELNCLYAFSKLIEKPDISLPEIFEGVVNTIPPGWQYPEVTCARLVFEDQILKTPNFNYTTWKQSSPVLVDGRPVGTLEVYYLEERPECDEGPFLEGERDLLNALAGRLGKIIQRRRAEEELSLYIGKSNSNHCQRTDQRLKVEGGTVLFLIRTVPITAIGNRYFAQNGLDFTWHYGQNEAMQR